MDESITYLGPLPEYASGGDRKRLVKVLCKSECGVTRWAEMSADYPGYETLCNAHPLTFSASCLKCGAIAGSVQLESRIADEKDVAPRSRFSRP
jgi:hypothetical protein